MAEWTVWPHRALAASAIFTTRRQLSLRVERLLADRKLRVQRRGVLPTVFVLAGSLSVVPAAGPFAPAIAFDDKPLQRTASQPAAESLLTRNGTSLWFKDAKLIVLRKGVKDTIYRDDAKIFILRSNAKTNGSPLPNIFKHRSSNVPRSKNFAEAARLASVLQLVTRLNEDKR